MGTVVLLVVCAGWIAAIVVLRRGRKRSEDDRLLSDQLSGRTLREQVRIVGRYVTGR
jgi:uncharacterized membrane protein